MRAGRLHLRGSGKEDPSIVVNASGHGGPPVRPHGGPVLTSFRLGSNATRTCGGNRPAAPARPGGVGHRRYGAKVVAANPVSWTSTRLRSKDGEDRVHASTLRCLASRQRHRPRPGRVLCVLPDRPRSRDLEPLRNDGTPWPWPVSLTCAGLLSRLGGAGAGVARASRSAAVDRMRQRGT